MVEDTYETDETTNSGTLGPLMVGPNSKTGKESTTRLSLGGQNGQELMGFIEKEGGNLPRELQRQRKKTTNSQKFD